MKTIFIVLSVIIAILVGLYFFNGFSSNGKYDELILDFKESVSKSKLQKIIADIAKQYNVKPRLNSIYSQSDNIYVIKGDKELLDLLRESNIAEYTEYIEPNYLYKANSFPNDPMYNQQWNFKILNMEQAWKITRGKGVVVAVIDTGIAQKLPDFAKTSFVDGYDFVNDRKDATDDNGHGSHVAGTIAQSTNNNLGTAGIAFESTLMSIKVLDEYGSGSTSDIAEAIKFAADNKADIINMNLGGGGENQMMIEAIDYAIKKGVVIIAAAGNEGSSRSGYPARYENVISVSALNPKGLLAPYSNYGAGVNISAPGGDISANREDGILQNTIGSSGESVFESYQGTSMASPHVAAVAALIKSAGVNDPEQIKKILFASVDKVDSDPRNFFGHGKLNAAKAVEMASGQSIPVNISSPTKVSNYWINFSLGSIIKKIILFIVSLLLGIFLKRRYPFNWNSNLVFGIFMGSCGFFIFSGIFHFAFPDWILKLLGSSITELGSFFASTSSLNPITASLLIPLGLTIFFLSNKHLKWFSIGTAIGVTGSLLVNVVDYPGLFWFGSELSGRIFLGVNAVVLYFLSKLALKSATGE